MPFFEFSNHPEEKVQIADVWQEEKRFDIELTADPDDMEELQRTAGLVQFLSEVVQLMHPGIVLRSVFRLEGEQEDSLRLNGDSVEAVDFAAVKGGFFGSVRGIYLGNRKQKE